MTDRFRLDGKVALITGGGRGLGRAMALGLAEAGADLVLVARRAADLEQVAAEIQAAGRRAVALPGDVSDPGTAARAVAAGLEALRRIDILVNNAGLLPEGRPLEETAAEDWQAVLDVNLMGSFHFTKAVAPHLLARGSGKVVNIASVLATFGVPGVSAYCAAKAGLTGFTRSLAVEWGPRGVQVNCIAPGLFDTDMSAGVIANDAVYQGILAGIPRGRHGRPDDLVGTAVWLCSPASDHVTGQVVHVDGGATIA